VPEDLIERLPNRIETALSQLLLPGEHVYVQLKGAWKEALICTGTRVVIIKGGLMTGQVLGNDTFQQPYSNISGVQGNFHLINGYFEVNSGGMQNTPKSYWSNNSSTDPARAPNCIALNSPIQRDAFQKACSFILSQITESRTGAGKQLAQSQKRLVAEPIEHRTPTDPWNCRHCGAPIGMGRDGRCVHLHGVYAGPEECKIKSALPQGNDATPIEGNTAVPSLTADLERLAALHRNGDLSDSEFQAAKSRLI
jgi:hypothetical protein